MDRWSGILKVPLNSSCRSLYKVGASLCFSCTSKSLTVPSANVLFFNGDHVEGTGIPVIEKLSDLQNIADVVISKFGSSVNAWVVEASAFNGPFAVYKDFIPSINRFGEPKYYDPTGFPASSSIVSLLSTCLTEAKNTISGKDEQLSSSISSSSCLTKTFILGFSKGGTVVNQLITELAAYSESKLHTQDRTACWKHDDVQEEVDLIPTTKEGLLSSIMEIHYVDVGLNSAGAYITDRHVIEKVADRAVAGDSGIRFVLHGTPRQWCDSRRVWIRTEKDKLLSLLESESRRTGGKLQACEKFYFADRSPDLQMHFEIIHRMDIS